MPAKASGLAHHVIVLRGQASLLHLWGVEFIFLRCIDFIQHPVRRDLRDHDAVRNAQQGVARFTLQMIHQLMDHHIDRGQRLDQKNRQGFGSRLWVHGKQFAGFTRGGFDVGIRWEVEVEGAFGGLVEFV